MSLETGIDTAHYAILDAVEEPLWKSKIHATIEDTIDIQMFSETPSVQTVGRRVDDLCDAGLIETCILSPDEVDRDLIIGYRRTTKGDDALAEKRSELLQEVAHTATNKACDQQRSVTPVALIKLIVDGFELDASGKARIEDEYGEEELLSLLALHFAQENAAAYTTNGHNPTPANGDEKKKKKNFQRLVQ